MNTIVKVMIGPVAGYIIGIALGAVTAFAFRFEGAARFIAIGCGLAGAVLGPAIFGRVEPGRR